MRNKQLNKAIGTIITLIGSWLFITGLRYYPVVLNPGGIGPDNILDIAILFVALILLPVPGTYITYLGLKHAKQTTPGTVRSIAVVTAFIIHLFCITQIISIESSPYQYLYIVVAIIISFLTYILLTKYLLKSSGFNFKEEGMKGRSFAIFILWQQFNVLMTIFHLQPVNSFLRTNGQSLIFTLIVCYFYIRVRKILTQKNKKEKDLS